MVGVALLRRRRYSRMCSAAAIPRHRHEIAPISICSTQGLAQGILSGSNPPFATRLNMRRGARNESSASTSTKSSGRNREGPVYTPRKADSTRTARHVRKVPQQETHALQQFNSLFDHLVGGGKHTPGNRSGSTPGGLQVDPQLELDRQLYWQVRPATQTKGSCPHKDARSAWKASAVSGA